MERKIANELLEFIQKGYSCYHVIQNIKEELQKNGFEELMESKHWSLREGGKYFVVRNSSSLIAFQIPKRKFRGFQIVASHSDSPTFKLKQNAEMSVEKKYIKLNTEKYGGMIMASWFDKPLSVAGKLMIQTEKGIEKRLVNIDRDLLVIPNLAIHMERNINDGYRYNAQTDLLPLYGGEGTEHTFMQLIAESAGVLREEIIDADLFLYNRMPGTIWGAKEEFLSSPKLDDLQCAFGSLKGFLACENVESIPVYCVFDNEEVGSCTKQGADSTFLKSVLYRMNLALGGGEEEYFMALSSSLMVSMDNAHAFHPNYVSKADPTHRPYLNGGIVIKYHANQLYTTDSVSGALFKKICDKVGAPYQVFFNRSDMQGGSTLGNISNTQVSLNTVDIGLPQLAMHSSYETAGVKDMYNLVKVAREIFSCSICMTEEGCYEIHWGEEIGEK